MGQFRNWYVRNQDAITWFVIGWVCLACIVALEKGDYIWAAIDAAIVYVNLKFRNFKIQ